eukprot:gnl/TRDRNA2_/TRDRNA2_155491_c1_seq3.p1 gnl/TRDRNA2_/TRDRNA2_155491_c1~~gnl/TRDRNA2_/TRDRNA2_155491_c1_seq3.p1  ORF type:complete len:219 (+),score=79.63 gnl/TRDRNA2_/TRDRNA2_155491_c1_seq3:188-844(+)
MLEMTVLNCRKRKAAEMEDFDLAHNVKQHEAAAGKRLAAAKNRFLHTATGAANGTGTVGGDDDLAVKLQELEQRKRKAVEDEDFDLAAELKGKQRELEEQKRRRTEQQACSQGADDEELARVRAQKLAAVEAENFELAAQLRRRELELSKRLPSARAAEGALKLLAPDKPEALDGEAALRSCNPQVVECAAGAGPDLWAAVAAELRAAAAEGSGGSSA